ncbi:MAG: MFS transporter [Anaerolineae bacterium]|jgi:FSR family fosmidomycin resistance protein-like MFS transporter
MSVKAEAGAKPVRAQEFQTGRVLTITIAHAVHDTYTAFLAPLLPVFIENLSLSKTEAGLLTAFNQAPSLTQPFIGHLADRLSLRYFVILAPAVTATAMSVLGLAPTYLVLALLLIAVGLSSATLHSVAPVMAGRLSGRNLGRGMGFWMVGGELGRTLGPLVIVAGLQFLGLKGTAWLMIGGWLVTILLFFWLRDVPGRVAEANDGLPWRQALYLMRPLLVPLVGIIIVRSFMQAALTTYLPIYLTEEGAELWFAGISLSVLEAAGVVGALLGGTLSDRMGRRTILLISLTATPVLMVLFVFAGGWIRFPLLLALGLTALSVTPVVMAIVQEHSPENRALANGTYMSLSFLIRSGVVVLVGAMGDLWGMRLAFLASALIPILGLPFLNMLPSRRS